MTTPIQPAASPAAATPTTQSSTSTSQQSSEWQQFYDWFAYGIEPGSGSTPSSAQAAPGTAASASQTSTSSTSSSSATSSASSGPALPTGNLWETNVTGTGPYGSSTVYNPTQFATAQTAQVVAQIVGGQEEDTTLGGPYTISCPIREIVGAGDNPLNAGLVADLFQKYGDGPGSYAWQVIDMDLGRTQS